MKSIAGQMETVGSQGITYYFDPLHHFFIFAELDLYKGQNKANTLERDELKKMKVVTKNKENKKKRITKENFVDNFKDSCTRARFTKIWHKH